MHLHNQKTRLNVEYLSLTSLKPDPNNPRKHSEKQVKTLAKVINEIGFNNPILIDNDNIVIAGHGRLMAAEQLKLETVPTIRLEHLTPAQVKAYRIADNRLAELADWDMKALKLELVAMKELDLGFDLTLTGFEMPKIDMLLNAVEDDAEIGKEPFGSKNIVTQTADIWLMGNHRIICGDSLLAGTYDQLLAGEKANLVFTDPPYNVSVKDHVLTDNKYGHEEFAMASGEMSDKEFEEFLGNIIENLRYYSTNGSMHYICMDWRHIQHLLAAGAQYDDLKNICIWNKPSGGMGSLYRSKHEMIAVFKNGRDPHVNNIELGKHGRYRTNVWDYVGQASIQAKAEKETEMHPTPKPVKMMADAMLDCSNEGQIVLDVFGGSGSTLIAAEKTKRQARLIEIEPRFVDVTVRRWQKLTGQKATLLSTSQTFDEVEAERTGGEA